MKIFFNFLRKDGTYLSENNLFSDLEKYRSEIVTAKRLCGSLVIENENDRMVIEDELGPLVNNFCFDSLPDLLSNNKARYSFFEVYGAIAFETIDDFVLITGDFVGEIFVPQKEFILAIYECGLRYIEFLKTLNESRFQGDLELLFETANATHEFLKNNHPSLLAK